LRYNDLHLTLKHVHWNVVGPNFIGVHTMIDPQVELVRGYADEVAERIAALGQSPQGTPGAIIKDRTWDDYSVGRDSAQTHLAALDLVYTGVIEDIRHPGLAFADRVLIQRVAAGDDERIGTGEGEIRQLVDMGVERGGQYFP
jgi:DNA-binding ferritin-like protein